MKVRRVAAADDPAGAITLLQRFFAEEGFATPDETIAANARRMLAIDSCALFVAEAGGEAIGVATVSMEFGIEYGWSAEMGDLYVRPDWRGQGVARALVAAVEAHLRENGASGYQVTLTPIGEGVHGLSRFYRALGFSSEGRVILHRAL
ncbi:GNAT family N-acetyltransferase [Aestuariivirga sp.]|uniref:GNAT family N-acetyltransferase n=1 Tax=Aestuariivirga sp. TaxID=2650926 RepID=UPI00391B6C91